jgi:ubiquinone/menaquinone biosynthesis C-methylase UbiE
MEGVSMSDSQAKSQNEVTPQRIMQFGFGFVVPMALGAAVHHRVFDVLDAGPKTIEEVSRETKASVRGLKAIMNVLVGFEFLKKEGDRYALTPESSAFLISTKPAYHGALIKNLTGPVLRNFIHLNEVVETGRAATQVNQEGPGSAFFHELVEAIFPMSYPAAKALASSLKLGEMKKPLTVLDLAAGSGVWGIALAESGPNVKVTAVDWAGVLDVTQRVAARHKLVDRFTFSAGDLESANFGSGHQVATLGHILHSEGAVLSKALLKKTFNALAPGGVIAIAEMLVNADRSGPPHALIFAVNMLVNTDAGDTFSFEEIGQWLKDAGFVNARLLENPSPSPLILADKPT